MNGVVVLFSSCNFILHEHNDNYSASNSSCFKNI